MEKGDFIGRAALEKAKAAGLKRTLVGLEAIDRGIPRDDYKVQDANGKEIGYVTSGSYAPFLKKNIALAYVPPAHAELGQELYVEIRGQKVKCKVVPTPFYKRPKKGVSPFTRKGQRNRSEWHIPKITSTPKNTSGSR